MKHQKIDDSELDLKFTRTNKVFKYIIYILGLLLFLSLIFSVYLLNTNRNSPTSTFSTITPTITETFAISTTAPIITTSINTIVKVFFSNQSLSEDKVYSFERTSNRSDIATFTMEQYISGPTKQESEQKYYSNLELSGISNCNGKDFSLNIENKKAILKFCRNVPLKGVGSDALLTKELNSNLLQFPTIEKVVLLNKDGKCLIDYSGLNQCGQ